MKIKIERLNKQTNPQQFKQEYEVSSQRLLDALNEIKTTQDNTLTYRCGCGSGVCGSCAVQVNGVERLSCKTYINEGDIISPIKYSEVIRDLVVELSHQERVLKSSYAFLEKYQEEHITQEDEKLIDVQSNCILCQSCYSSCPVYEVNPSFLGPYALTRVLRYVNDKKEHQSQSKIDAIQSNGVWDCTLCGNCTMVCPQFIDPKTDIMNLRSKSVQAGYSDPHMNNMDFDSGFNTDFGFNPNGF